MAIYVNKVSKVEAFQYNGVESSLESVTGWVKEEWDAERLYVTEYGKEGKRGLFYSIGGRKAYKRYYIGAGHYLVKWPGGVITSVEKSVFERIFEPKTEE